jgi:CRISPR/Cas system-associated exonuclease Cas4 (RecB family)
MRSALPIRKSGFPTPSTFSQSSLQDYADCPRRFQLRYLDHLTWPAAESEPVAEFELRQSEGLKFHRHAQQYLLGLPAESLTPLADTLNLKRWWDNFLRTDLGVGNYAQRVETTWFAAVGEHRLVAKYDLIATRPHEAIIFDWKTSARRPANEWLSARWQTRVYRSLLMRAGAALHNLESFEPSNVKMTYWFAEFADEPAEFTYEASQFRRDWSAIQQLIQEISTTESFPLTEDHKMCRFCAYRSYCDRGTQAGAATDSGSETDTGDVFDIDFEQIGEIEF